MKIIRAVLIPVCLVPALWACSHVIRERRGAEVHGRVMLEGKPSEGSRIGAYDKPIFSSGPRAFALSDSETESAGERVSVPMCCRWFISVHVQSNSWLISQFKSMKKNMLSMNHAAS